MEEAAIAAGTVPGIPGRDIVKKRWKTYPRKWRKDKPLVEQSYRQTHRLFTQKGGANEKKKKTKEKTYFEYGKLKEFPTFRHDKQNNKLINPYL